MSSMEEKARGDPLPWTWQGKRRRSSSRCARCTYILSKIFAVMHAKWRNKDVGHAAKAMYFMVKPEAMHSELQSEESFVGVPIGR